MRSHNRRHDIPFLYKYMASVAALSALGTQSLRWSTPLLFNDPFDVPREWNGFTYGELEEALVRRFAAYLRGEARPGTAAALRLLDILERSTPPAEVHLQDLRFFYRLMRGPMERYINDMHEAWTEKVPGIRILCFSADPSPPTMWAHYADSYAGVVLQFESSDERDSSWLLAEPVIYQADKPALPHADEWARAFLGEIAIDWDEILREYHYVKHTDWAYEREYRVVSAKKQFETAHSADYVFHPEDLRGVILGPKIDPSHAQLIRDILVTKYPNAHVFEARLDHGARRISHVAT